VIKKDLLKETSKRSKYFIKILFFVKKIDKKYIIKVRIETNEKRKERKKNTLFKFPNLSSGEVKNTIEKNPKEERRKERKINIIYFFTDIFFYFLQ